MLYTLPGMAQPIARGRDGRQRTGVTARLDLFLLSPPPDSMRTRQAHV